MSVLATAIVSLPTSAFPPLAVGFMGLGTGYLIYGPTELFGYPRRSQSMDFGMGLWGIFLPGFMQFFTGTFIFVGLVFGTFTDKLLYMAGLAFTSYGVHWWVIGWNRLKGVDARANFGMAVGFLLISILGMIAFFGGHDNPVGGLFLGLTLIYICDIFVSLKADLPKIGGVLERVMGALHIGVGFWLIYLMFAVTLNFTLNYGLTV